MFNKHLLKVIIGFCGMILVGLISLVVINSLSEQNTPTPKKDEKSTAVTTLPPVNTTTTTKAKK